jgi:hypothetical protein
MCSIRDGLPSLGRIGWLATALAWTLGIGAGCQLRPRSYPAAVDQTPLIVDQAIQFRDWDPSVAYYANGSVPAWPTRFPFVPKPTVPDVREGMYEPAQFVGQSFALPVMAILMPPFTPVLWQGEVVPPTYTAQPPLPAQ